MAVSHLWKAGYSGISIGSKRSSSVSREGSSLVTPQVKKMMRRTSKISSRVAPPHISMLS